MLDEVKKEINQKLEAGDIGGAIAVAGGFFSVCWDNPAGAGEFDSTRAAALSDWMAERVQAYIRHEVVRGRSGPMVDAHSVKSGLHDPEAEQRGSE